MMMIMIRRNPDVDLLLVREQTLGPNSEVASRNEGSKVADDEVFEERLRR